MKFKVGDVVKIREDLEIGKNYNRYTLREGKMSDLRGTYGKVTRTGAGDYQLSPHGFWWSEIMLEPVSQTFTSLKDLVDERNEMVVHLVDETIKAQLKLFEECDVTVAARIKVTDIFVDLREEIWKYRI